MHYHKKDWMFIQMKNTYPDISLLRQPAMVNDGYAPAAYKISRTLIDNFLRPTRTTFCQHAVALVR